MKRRDNLVWTGGAIAALMALSAAAFLPVRSAPTMPPGVAYQSARDLLVQGRHFERAARLLERGPSDYRTALALGCAYADQAAALGYAAASVERRTVEQGVYRQNRELWEAGHNDPESPLYRVPEPTPPSDEPITIKDDGGLYRMTREETARAMTDLSRKALAAWGRAASLANTDSERAEVDYVSGWGVLLLQRYNESRSPRTDEASSDSSLAPYLPPIAAAKAAFEDAVMRAPEEAIYWRSLGDCQYLSETERRASEDSYQRCLKLDPRNGALWYRLYGIAAEEDRDTDSAGPRTRTYLERMVRYDPDNALGPYLLAAIAFKEGGVSTPTFDPFTRPGMEAKGNSAPLDGLALRRTAAKALSYMEQGMRRPHCALPLYRPAVPRTLACAWGYEADPSDNHFSPTLRELARCGYGMSLYLAAQGDKPGAERMAQAVVGLGKSMAGDVHDPFPRKGQPGQGLFQMAGDAIVRMGYTGMVRADTASAVEAQTALTEYDRLAQARWREYLIKSGEYELLQ